MRERRQGISRRRPDVLVSREGLHRELEPREDRWCCREVLRAGSLRLRLVVVPCWKAEMPLGAVRVVMLLCAVEHLSMTGVVRW